MYVFRIINGRDFVCELMLFPPFLNLSDAAAAQTLQTTRMLCWWKHIAMEDSILFNLSRCHSTSNGGD